MITPSKEGHQGCASRRAASRQIHGAPIKRRSIAIWVIRGMSRATLPSAADSTEWAGRPTCDDGTCKPRWIADRAPSN